MNRVSKKEREDVLFVSTLHMSWNEQAQVLGKTAKQIKDKRRHWRRIRKTIGGLLLDEWVERGSDIPYEDTVTYGTSIQDLLIGEDQDSVCMSIITDQKGKRNPDREANRREVAQNYCDIQTNKWLNTTDPAGERLPESWSKQLDSTCKEIGDMELDRFFKRAFIKAGFK